MRFLTIFICFSVLSVNICRTAHFEPLHEMTFCNSDATAQTNQQGPYYNPKSSWSANNNNVYSESSIDYISMSSGQSNAWQQLQPFSGSYEESLPSVYLSLTSSGFAYLTEDRGHEGVWSQGWGNAATVSPGYATGNFYKIMPDAYEMFGDSFTITIYYSAFAGLDGMDIDNLSSAYVNGGFAGDDLLITLNCTDYDAPQESEILHSFSPLIYVDSHLSAFLTYSYQVRIGDIIGIHAGVGSHAERVTIDSSTLTAYAGVEITIMIDGYGPFDPARADLNRDGRVNLLDFALFASAWLWEEELSM